MLNTFRVTVLSVIALGLYYTWVTGGAKTRFGRQAYTPSYPVACKINNAVGLTYDEGPSTVTKDILSYLAAANVTATFHIVTVYLSNNLNLQSYVKAAYSAGHDIGLRFNTQMNAGNMTLAAFQAEIMAESQIIYNLIGVWPKFLRLGGVSTADIDAWCLSQGFVITSYAVDPMDYASASTSITATYSSYLSKLVGGQSFISYESDLYTSAAQALPNTLGVIAGYSYNVVPLSKCLATPSYRTVAGSSSGGYVAGTSSATGTAVASKSDATTHIQFMSGFIALMILGAALVML
ncbi:hypothetical protein SmJEL517_g01082 [Synchytrium microbalum]|uniref:NodB homology domain-containing protein n=1 Tax=Synchytrium microbalum TaxID=1806994 RepID=A0A507CBQ6_9FUNG|nr:uncharacterized protein SmJEL517_g01082 [Synchytrium microbalum]TPX36921.1 hypothetical protein SmJEL517_g01082 [Synchytrium microbalum]